MGYVPVLWGAIPGYNYFIDKMHVTYQCSPQSVVQVETIGDFGAVFIVFMAGLELSPEKLKKVCFFFRCR